MTDITFILNEPWTFSHEDCIFASDIRYLIAYVACYVLKVAALKYFNGYCGYSHLLVQAAAVAVIVPLLFIAQKLWVFREDAASILRAQDL